MRESLHSVVTFGLDIFVLVALFMLAVYVLFTVGFHLYKTVMTLFVGDGKP